MNSPGFVGRLMLSRVNHCGVNGDIEKRQKIVIMRKHAGVQMFSVYPCSDPAVRGAYHRELAEHVKGKVVFSPESLLSQSGEQFLRNVADILLQRKAKLC